MATKTLSNETALRIALASKALPGTSIADMLDALYNCLGEDINETNLNQITVTNLKTAFGQTYELDGEEDGEDADANDIACLKEAVRILWGEIEDEEHQHSLPHIEPYSEGEMPHSIRVAVSSNSGENLDGHFGSCLRYLIYQLSATEMKLIDVRSALEADLQEDKNSYRVSLIKDCQAIFVVSVGGPAAAKIIKGGVYPMKKDNGGKAREILADLQGVIQTSPPPWMAKALGVADGQRVKNYKGS
jgi:nitrogen fixation protein NifX